MDSEDDEYIAQVNGSTTGSPRVRKRKKAATLSENAFEALINFFEKEFFKLVRTGGGERRVESGYRE